MRRFLLGEWEAITWVTASVSRDLWVDLYSFGGMMPPTVYGTTTKKEFSLKGLFHVAGAGRGDD